MKRVNVLYEDQLVRGGTPGKYPLHQLVVSCVSDVVGVPAEALKEYIAGNPRKGNDKLLNTLRDDADKLTSSGGWVIAVLDNDRVRQCGGIQLPDGTNEEVVEKILGLSQVRHRVAVILLEKNVEDLLRVASDCMGLSNNDARLGAALAKGAGALSSRDSILGEVVFKAGRPARDCILQGMPSFADLVLRTAVALQCFG